VAVTEPRHGSAGARQASGGVGGHIGAPHPNDALRLENVTRVFGALSAIENISFSVAVRGVSRNRFSFVRSSRSGPADELLERVRLTQVAGHLVAALSHGQQRQLEIGMALAGAPRLILFDEPAAGLSPGERAELVALLRSLPPHMGFVLIEHDLDIALRVVDRVTVMHNARVLKHGSPAEIENDAEVQSIYMGDRVH